MPLTFINRLTSNLPVADDPQLYDVNLLDCPDGWFGGAWQVRTRSLGPPTIFSQAAELHLHPNPARLELLDQARHQHSGHWAVERDPILKRPYLTLEAAGEQTRALITRLRRSSQGQYASLTLYLQSGTELILDLLPTP
ncbi:hypothetical protein [Hymenobacter daecheongensis]|uniref:hypothetical protein n=1 Tax=Hymenobacter daecheongensis TaxID=496053 RepID=UPI000933546E|nr:hypothetical protein [Hymenobacter daecheongensis]